MQSRTMKIAAVGVTACAVLWGCHTQERTPGVSAQAKEQAVKAGKEDSVFERQAKLNEARVSVVPVTLDWQAANDARVKLGLEQGLQSQIDAVPMPVLLPRTASLSSSAFITKGPGWYAAAMDADGLNVALHGYSIAHQRPDLVEEFGDEAPKPGEPRTSRTHMIVSVSFERFGASYIMEVECARPSQDARCADDRFALSLFEELVMVGGKQ